MKNLLTLLLNTVRAALADAHETERIIFKATYLGWIALDSIHKLITIFKDNFWN